MGDNRERSLNSETNRSSCPYPVTSGHFPMPSTSEYTASALESERNDPSSIDSVPIGMLSPYFRDRVNIPENVPLTGVSTSGAENSNIQHNIGASAPYMNGFTAGESSHTRQDVGFSNPLADRAEMISCDPPPSYNELFAPKNLIEPKMIPNGNVVNARANTPPRAVVVPRTTTASGSRIITHAPVQLVGVRSSSNNNASGMTVVFIVVLVLGLAFFAVFVHSRP